MPRMYRVMTPDEDGKPKIGATARTLGVRPQIDGLGLGDIPVREGSVAPGTGGMSVAPQLQDLPLWRIPRRYALPGKGMVGTGKYEDSCWWMGDGLFRNEVISDRLNLVVDSPTHGEVQPSSSMLLEAYQTALSTTRDSWSEEIVR
jgi:hypothetical protein